MKITTAGELQKKFKAGYQLAGETDGELEWFSPNRQSAREKLAMMMGGEVSNHEDKNYPYK